MIFIIGGSGFVGSAFARICAGAGKEFLIINRQNYRESVGTSCDILINANGNAKKFLAQQDPLYDFDASVKSVRASLIDFKYDFYVYLSSCDVYPDCSSRQTTLEDQDLDVSKQIPYGFHKYLAEQCVRHMAKRWLIIRLGGLVGSGLKKNPIFDILSGGPLRVDPESEMQFIYTDKAAEIVLNLLDEGLGHQIFNLCSRGLVKLREVMDLVGYNVDAVPGGPRVRYDANIEKISRWVRVPETRQTVFAFVQAELDRRREIQRSL
jgi:nucleoside-diphosphate-sugar epimerase